MSNYCIEKENQDQDINLPIKQDSHYPHPCMNIFISHGLGEDYKTAVFNTRMLYEMMNSEKVNPLTSLPFSVEHRERISLYYSCLENLPQYYDIPKDLYERWIESLKKNSKYSQREKELIDIEARCFLQPEDLVDIYREFEDKDSMSIREKAERYMKENGKSWLIRNCSLKNTDNSKAYAITILYGGVPYSFPIVHRIGDGFYYNVTLARGDTIDKKFSFSSFHISIVDLLKTVLREQLYYMVNRD